VAHGARTTVTTPNTKAFQAPSRTPPYRSSILIALGVRELDAIRVAAIANAPVSFGALGAPIIASSPFPQ
jgi:hypothetical protein